MRVPAVCYIAHPVGALEPERELNKVRVLRWFRWLLKRYPDVAFVIPWFPYVCALDETPENRARGIRDDLAALQRCSSIALVGGRLSPGMAAELQHARDHDLDVYDFLDLGDEPPEDK